MENSIEMIEQVLGYLGTGIGSVLAWIWANRWLIPTIEKWWRERKDDEIRRKDSIVSVEEHSYNVYEGQVKFLVEQIDSLQGIIKLKSDELADVYKRLAELRKRVQELEIELLKANENAVVYKDKCCMKAGECPYRVPCCDAEMMVSRIHEKYEQE